MADGPGMPGSSIVLSHWPDSGTPWPLKADLSAEIAFAYLEQPEHHVDAEWVTNGHLDVDGFVSVFVLTRPDYAQAHREDLVGVAAAGDFADRCTDRQANACFALGALRDPKVSTLSSASFVGSEVNIAANHYQLLLPLMPTLIDDPERFEPLWREERATVDAAEAAFASGDLRIEDVPDAELAVVYLPADWPGGGVQRGVLQRDTPVHPLVVHRRTNRWRVAYVDPARRDYRLIYRFESWVQHISRGAGRADLRPIARKLTAADPAGGEWIAGGRKTFLAWLHRRDYGPSGLEPEQFVSIVTDGLRGAPITWTPYDPPDGEPRRRRSGGYG